MERISTGNPTLDRILDGGFPRNSINVIMGAPGSGKTILAEQLAFANANRERPVLYLSTLSEPLTKMVRYLENYTFAKPERIGREVVYMSLAEQIETGPDALTSAMLELIKHHRPHIIVIDSFKAITDLFEDQKTWRRTVFHLAGLLTAYDTTSFWIGEYSWNGDGGDLPIEFAVADGILELHRVQHGSRDERYLRVAKLRGSTFSDGRHAFWIGADGLRVFPRLVTPTTAGDYETSADRLRSGIPGLDDMLGGGWLRGTSTLVEGPSGAGKTMLGVHFLIHGVQHGEPGLLASFQENPAQLRRAIRGMGYDPEALVGPGKLDHLYTSPVELQIDTVVRDMFERLEARGVRRIVIDALGDLERSATDPKRFTDYIYALTQYFAARNMTAMLMAELPRAGFSMHAEHRAVSPMSDNIVLLTMDMEDQLSRSIRILKTRGSSHDERPRRFRITSRGVTVE